MQVRFALAFFLAHSPRMSTRGDGSGGALAVVETAARILFEQL